MIIHVRLLDEGVDVWRPVSAVKQNESNVYLILPSPSNVIPEGEHWEFSPGEKVFAEKRELSDGPALIAYKRVIFERKTIWQILFVWVVSFLFIVWPVIVGKRAVGDQLLMFMLIGGSPALIPPAIYAFIAMLIKKYYKKAISWWLLIPITAVIWVFLLEVLMKVDGNKIQILRLFEVGPT
ncbi:hypothetical protein ACLVWU_08700 [Bdellovibrio sp. HCB290]|uniref:hypothetical protein n=1 Tax=Bdellovibrio sp. HCB290 TaxID=3394356 RepID=UPI0039B46042